MSFVLILVPALLILAIIILRGGGKGIHKFPARFSARVVWVCDGDSFYVRRNLWGRRFKIRLLGMDAPETAQRYGRASTAKLKSLIHRRWVVVTALGRDRYGRLVAHVRAGNRDVSTEMIRSGFAWPYFAYGGSVPDVERETYRAAYEDARAHRRGLWRDDAPEPPWAWRRRHDSLLSQIKFRTGRKIRGSKT